MPPARVHQGYQLLKAADPSRPVFVCLDTIPPTASAGPLWHDYLNATDVVISAYSRKGIVSPVFRICAS